MLVTINTDASYYPQYKVGGYAIWITSDDGRLKYANGFKDMLASQHDAEFKSIINALHILKKTKLTVSKLIINTDSQTVIDVVNGTPSKKGKPKYLKDNYNLFLNLIKQMGINDVTLRHVKAHTHTKNARHWVNDWLDKQAKKAAKELVKNKFGIIMK